MITLIPECCAMPEHDHEGATYQCLTCGTLYQVLDGTWTLVVAS